MIDNSMQELVTDEDQFVANILRRRIDQCLKRIEHLKQDLDGFFRTELPNVLKGNTTDLSKCLSVRYEVIRKIALEHSIQIFLTMELCMEIVAQEHEQDDLSINRLLDSLFDEKAIAVEQAVRGFSTFHSVPKETPSHMLE